MKEGRIPEYPEKTPDEELQKCHILKPENLSPNQDSNPHSSIGGRVEKHTYKHRLVGLVVRRPPRERKIRGSNPACDGIFQGSSRTNDLKIGTPVATLPGAWRYRVSTGTGRPGVSIL